MAFTTTLTNYFNGQDYSKQNVPAQRWPDFMVAIQRQ